MKLGKLDLRNPRQRDIALAMVALSILAALLWYFYMYQPTRQEISDLELQVTTLSTQVARGIAARDNLPALREETARLERERLDFLAQLPRESEVAALLDELRLNAEQADVVIEVLAQGNVNEAVEGVRPIGFNLTARAPFERTMAFLGHLEEMRRFTKIRQLGLSVANDEGGADPALQSDFAFTVYVYTGEDPGDSGEN